MVKIKNHIKYKSRLKAGLKTLNIRSSTYAKYVEVRMLISIKSPYPALHQKLNSSQCINWENPETGGSKNVE